MPVLPNARHERFAQELAKGKTATEAYELAGYKRSASNASHLQAEDSISQRVAEILAEREQIHREATAKAVERAAVTKQWVLERLVENVQRSMQATAVTDDDGQPIGNYQYQGTVANRALELLGKEMGMFIDRREVGLPGEFTQLENMTADELRAFVAGTAQAAGLRQDAAAHGGGAGPPRGKLN